MLSEKLLSIGETAKLLGVSVPTVRRWQKAGRIQEKRRTFGNHRRFSQQDINEALGESPSRKVVGYARVSTHDQKKTLKLKSNASLITAVMKSFPIWGVASTAENAD